MRINYTYINCNEHIIWIAKEVKHLIDENIFSIRCKVRNLRKKKEYDKVCIYSTKEEAERKRLVWGKIFKKENT